MKKPKKVLDLGAGTGLLSYYWYIQCSSAEYMLVDIADEILDVSRKRFLGLNNATKGFEGERIDYDNALCNRMVSEIRHAVELGHLPEECAEKCIAEIHAVEQVQHKQTERYGKTLIHADIFLSFSVLLFICTQH